jgi:hypothetical protein
MFKSITLVAVLSLAIIIMFGERTVKVTNTVSVDTSLMVYENSFKGLTRLKHLTGEDIKNDIFYSSVDVAIRAIPLNLNNFDGKIRVIDNTMVVKGTYEKTEYVKKPLITVMFNSIFS